MSIVKKINTFRRIFNNMGARYVLFRSWFEVSKRIGLKKRRFPVNPPFKQFLSLEEWQKQSANFFFDSKASISFPKNPSTVLKQKIDRLRKGELCYFNASYLQIGRTYDWLTNPDSGYKYKLDHWLDINDFSSEAGDIKYVWEKSRFSYLLTIIRYDYHFEEDCAAWVFEEIDHWMTANPINQGPNYKCSQEISLRILNWLFALYYYKKSSELTKERFAKIMHYCYWQLNHVRANIHFSRIAVRNNHAITETMMLYLGGIFFPFFPNTQKWSEEGLKWLEEEVAYQVYEDGTFLQFSHNYHRVLIQLLTWALYLSKLNNKELSTIFLARTQKSLQYLYQCQIKENGYLPNYGANDGALFFPLNDCEYRDYRPQLNALAYYFTGKDLYKKGTWTEDRAWYTSSLPSTASNFSLDIRQQQIQSFPIGGYYIHRDTETLTFIRCGNHKDRPSHADNLHLDIWYKGINYLRDAGTYKYNTDKNTLSFFVGTKGHNTVMLGEYDQMKKGERFVWLDWSQAVTAELHEQENNIVFNGKIKAFQSIASNIFHSRSVVKDRFNLCWTVEDTIEYSGEMPIRQVWNVHPDFFDVFIIDAKDSGGNSIKFQKRNHFYSSEYGIKEEAIALVFETFEKTIKTTIRII